MNLRIEIKSFKLRLKKARPLPKRHDRPLKITRERSGSSNSRFNTASNFSRKRGKFNLNGSETIDLLNEKHKREIKDLASRKKVSKPQ